MEICDYSYLIVDDVRTVRITLIQMLSGARKPKVIQAEDGAEALSALFVAAPLVDAVITDINMPKMTGLELLKAIRTGERGLRRDLPVALFTGFGDMRFVSAAMSLDANAFLVKPAARTVVAERIATMMQLAEGAQGWLKPVDYYASIPLPEMETEDGAEAVPPRAPAPQPGAATVISDRQPPAPAFADPANGATAVALSDVAPGMVLARDLVTEGGALILPKGSALTDRYIARLGDLSALSKALRTLWIVPEPVA